MTTDIERAAFEEWVVGRLENVFPTTFLRRPTGEYFSAFIELRWEGWQARASRPITDQQIEAGATAIREDEGCDWITETSPNMRDRYVARFRKALSAALNGGTDETV